MHKKLIVLSKQLDLLGLKKSAEQINRLAQFRYMQPDYDDPFFDDPEAYKDPDSSEEIPALSEEYFQTVEYPNEIKNEPTVDYSTTDSPSNSGDGKVIIDLEGGAEAFVRGLDNAKELILNPLFRNIVNLLKNFAVDGKISLEDIDSIIMGIKAYSAKEGKFLFEKNKDPMTPEQLKGMLLNALSYIGMFVNIGNIRRREFKERELGVSSGDVERVGPKEDAHLADVSKQDFGTNRLSGLIDITIAILEKYQDKD